MIGQTIPIQMFTVVVPMVLLVDTFTDTNGVNLTAHTMDVGGGWTAGSGSFEISGNRATAGPPFSDMFYWADAGQTDYTLTCTVTMGASGSSICDLVVRVTDKDNLWLIEPFTDDDTFTLYQKTAGGYTQRSSASVTISHSTSYVIEVVTNGNTISATLDGANSVSYGSATQGNASTLCGLGNPYTAGNFWDNFQVTG